MEDFQSRQLAVATIRARVAPVGGSWLSDSECVQIALACKCRGSVDLLGVLFNRHVTALLSTQIANLAITDLEWRALFGHEVSHTRTADVTDITRSDRFRSETEKVVAAMRSTVVEATQKAAWQRPVTRVGAYICLHFDNHEDAMEATMGGLVRSDLRRLEDLCAEMEDRGVDTMELAAMISALSVAAC